jgi:hypothetical protein
MIKTLFSPPLLHCAHCQVELSECPEKEFGDWIVRCFECGAKNLIDVIVNRPVADVEVVGWRE